METSFFERGWCRFSLDPVLGQWVEGTIGAAREAVRKPANRQWMRCGGTWFAGVNVLENDSRGAVDGGPALAGRACDFIARDLGHPGLAWDRGQVSVCYPGYPRQSAGETDPAYQYRLKCDAAHIDGLLPVGTRRRRFAREYHAFLLGIPMTSSSGDASPFVVWEGSHELVRQTLLDAFEGVPPGKWAEVDVTDVYHGARKHIFQSCPRTLVPAQPGEAFLVHRLALHGIAPWGDGAKAGEDARMIVYFRPPLPCTRDWLLSR